MTHWLYASLVIAGALGSSLLVRMLTLFPLAKLMTLPIDNYRSKYGQEITVENLRDWIEKDYGFHIWQVRVAAVFGWVESAFGLIFRIAWWGVLIGFSYLAYQDSSNLRWFWVLPGISLAKGVLNLLVSLPCWMITGKFPFERNNALAWLKGYSKP